MNDPSWTDIAQTAFVVVALVFTGIQIRRAALEQKYRNYLEGISGFVDLSNLMVSNPILQEIYVYSKHDLKKNEYAELSSEEKTRVLYCDSLIALCETVWYASEKGWIPDDEWKYWEGWARDLNQSPYFRWALNWVKSRNDYDGTFLALISTPAQDSA